MPVGGVDTSVRNAWAGKVRGVAWLIELEFLAADLTTPSPVYLATWPETKDIGGKTYLGVGNLVQVSPVAESENPTQQRVTISASVVDTAMKALAIGQVERYRNRRARLYLQTYGETFQPIGTKVLRWSGFMDRVKIPRPRGSSIQGVPAPAGGRIELECSRAGVARSRNAEGLRLTNSQQQAEFPGDLGLEYIKELLETPTLWLSKKFQEV